MASKYNYKNDFKVRISYSLKLKNVLVNKSLIRDNLYFYNKILTFLTKIRNRCIETGSSRSVSKKYKLGRMCLKDYSRSGLLTGIRKSS